MRFSRRQLIAGTAACGVLLGTGNALSTPAEWVTGDLIFHTSRSKQSSAIMWATKSLYSHCGIIRVYKKQTFVIEASNVVKVTPLQTWIKRGRLGRYSVFRDARLDDAPQQQRRERLWRAAKRYRGRPYDALFLFDNRSIYCSELIWLAYKDIGIDIGERERAGDLDSDNPLSDYIFKKRWRRHPKCRGVKRATECKARVMEQEMVTPDAIARDERLERVFSNYPL